jgi:two-component system response regulator CpxR
MSLSFLLVDDDAELCNMMVELFAGAGNRLDCSHNGRDGLSRAIEGSYDLVILDVMLPIIDGFTVLDEIRKRKPVPIIILTARGQPGDRIHGLDRGADDYLPKPFDPEELLARVRAVLRRFSTSPPEGAVRSYGDIRVNSGTREVWRGNDPISLTALEFDILNLLVRSAGRVISRDEIMSTLFERMPSPYDRSLDVHISHLRKKLERGHMLIRTIRGVGYTFTAEEAAEP